MSLLDFASILLGMAFLTTLVRVLRGPSLADRVVAADVCIYMVVCAFALLAVRLEVAAFVDAVLVATIIGFLTAVSLARLIVEKGHKTSGSDEGPGET